MCCWKFLFVLLTNKNCLRLIKVTRLTAVGNEQWTVLPVELISCSRLIELQDTTTANDDFLYSFVRLSRGKCNLLDGHERVTRICACLQFFLQWVRRAKRLENVWNVVYFASSEIIAQLPTTLVDKQRSWGETRRPRQIDLSRTGADAALIRRKWWQSSKCHRGTSACLHYSLRREAKVPVAVELRLANNGLRQRERERKEIGNVVDWE